MDAKGVRRLTLGSKVYRGYNCVQAWAEFGMTVLVELLDAVRNRVLDFSLALWKENPNAGDLTNSSAVKVEPSKVTQIFNTKIYGGSANLVGSARDFTVYFSILPKNFGTLTNFLKKKGLQDDDIRDLDGVLISALILLKLLDYTDQF